MRASVSLAGSFATSRSSHIPFFCIHADMLSGAGLSPRLSSSLSARK